MGMTLIKGHPLLVPNTKWARLEDKYTRGNPANKIKPKPYTLKYLRYAMIKGKAERKRPELRPAYCRPMTEDMIEEVYQFVKGR